MIFIIANDPDSAMDEEQHAGPAVHLLGLHDVELYRAPILTDGLFGDCHSGHVDCRLPLQVAENLLGLGLRQLPERAAVRVGKKGPNLGINAGVSCGVGSREGSLCHKGCSES
jgi:hypothetical protein